MEGYIKRGRKHKNEKEKEGKEKRGWMEGDIMRYIKRSKNNKR
jgi:hypothetical protein